MTTTRQTPTLRAAAAAALAIAALVAACAPTVPTVPTAPMRQAAATEPEVEWNEMQGEKLLALKTRGDAARGAIAFEPCQGCHRAGALGRPDGSYPRLAGQHDTVLIKQMADVRAGRRVNPKMAPFIDQHAVTVQDMADIAAYLSRLPVPPDQGKGPGADLARGAAIYADRCNQCHGDVGEGDAASFFPRVSGQHYRYLLREMVDIRDGARHNANPRMVAVIRGASDAELQAVADYMSRLPVTAGR